MATTPGTEDLSFDVTDPDASAIFLPSLGPNYIKYTKLYKQKMEELGWERHPQKMTPEGREFDFLREDSESFYWPYALYSAGHADLRLDTHADKIAEQEAMIRDRNPNTILLGDSGGYQIGKGLLEFDWENFESAKNDELRLKILRWLESTADISMTLDVPTWGIKEKKCKLMGFKDCLEKTLYNHDFFIKNRKEGATKFLNILHGRNPEETDIWYEAVKDLPFEGWAFAGINMIDFERIMKRLIIMRDEGYLNEIQNWIHFLGVSRISSSCAFSAIQRNLRKYVDPSITISYDASSPFYSSAKGRVYTRHVCSRKSLNYSMDFCFDNKDLQGSKIPFPFNSPLGKKITVGDICVRGHDYRKSNGEPAKSSWDTFSYMFIMNHNCYMHTKGIIEANRIYQLPRKNAANWIPANLLDFRELCEEIFTSEKPFDVITQNHKLLNNLSGVKAEKSKLSAIDSTGLLTFEDDAANIVEDMQEHEFDDSAISDV